MNGMHIFMPHPPLFLSLERAREKAKENNNGRYVGELVQGAERVLEEESLREAQWVGSEAKGEGGAGLDSAEAVLADQDRAEASAPESVFAQEALAVASRLVRQHDAAIG